MTDETTAGSNTDTSTEGSQSDGAENTATSTIMTDGETGEADTSTDGSEGSSADDSDGSEGGDDDGESGGEGKNDDGSSEVPESYEFTMPEGMELDQGLADAVSPVFKELGLTQDAASKLTEAFAQHQQAQAEKGNEVFQKQLDDWKSELQSDESFGGDDFDKNAKQVAHFIQKTVPAEIKDEVMGLLNMTGAGNHPGLVKYFHHLSKVFPVSEDNPGTGSAANHKTSREERMYPNS